MSFHRIIRVFVKMACKIHSFLIIVFRVFVTRFLSEYITFISVNFRNKEEFDKKKAKQKTIIIIDAGMTVR